MKNLCFIFFVCFATTANAVTYYVSTSGDDNNNGITLVTAWQTLSKVQAEAGNGLIKAGDSIAFKKGDVFTGTLTWTTIRGQHCATGSPVNPITFTNYGKGVNPVFLYPPGGNKTAENRVLMFFSGVDYIQINGLDFTDMDTLNDKRTPANCGIPVYLGSIGEATTNHCSISNVNISLCGMGIVIIGDFNKVTNCRLTNFKNLKSTPNTGGSTAYEDYGANAITITGSNNEISNNYISSAWAESLDFGWNGGACEMFNNCNDNKIIHNTIYDCGGVAEFGGQEKDAAAANNLFAFNKIINCGTLSYCNINGEFAIAVSNVQYFNNTIIEDSSSRFSGPHTGKGILSAAAKALIRPDAALFVYNGNPAAKTVYDVRNNIFQLSSGIAIVGRNNADKLIHENNIYGLLQKSVTNFELNPSERMVTEPVFNKTNSADPLLWNYHLTKNTRGMNAGADAHPLPVYQQALISIIIIEAVMSFTCSRPALFFDLSANNILKKIEVLFYLVNLFCFSTNPSAWFG